MPVQPARTATAPTRAAFADMRAGDILWTKGGGLSGFFVRHGSASPYGHCAVAVTSAFPDPITGEWMVMVNETFPVFPPWRPALLLRKRAVSSIAAVARMWRTEAEQALIVRTSESMVRQSLPYAWAEIAVIALAGVLPHSVIPNADATKAVICSNHVAACLKAARTDDYLRFVRYPPHRMWPGGLHRDLQAWQWCDNRQAEMCKEG